ncbi:Sec-independent protein translocase subunit TatA [Mycolicibacter hiberniae]|uniref:Sec-independent protein translocase protein TatA n=1 Tax=Mycolicibacter hiberniae TaxID=29314 RepID=A0A7I7X069_9MYCO|nr:Sec-independent protein translocase subunit TatA [Mycolicibacter hiberniae]MCV7085271.1 Sec-independent protein translocase subunit TatA [Mycolicibacter hiberniae]ORV70384.1 preprotein translocase subunit TatA [Mycolicibacter hiberniae]BBZ23156.1 Sec-independent protein translocase protein TatA [Mycolicibacter hiberniae]
MNALAPSHLAILAVAVIVLFGAKRLPDAARSLGKSLRIFKSEVRELQNESKPDSTATSTTVASERVDPPAAGGPSA